MSTQSRTTPSMRRGRSSSATRRMVRSLPHSRLRETTFVAGRPVFFLTFADGQRWTLDPYSNFRKEIEQRLGVPLAFQNFLTRDFAGLPLRVLPQKAIPRPNSIWYFREKAVKPGELTGDNVVGWANNISRVAAIQGNLRLLQWLDEHGYHPEDNMNICTGARDFDQKEIIDWLASKNIFCGERTRRIWF